MKKDKLPDLSPAHKVEPMLLAEGPINTTQDFHLAVEQAQVERIDSLEVTDELFKKLFHHVYKENTQLYVTYGSPGIKVYREGKKAECDKLESMTAEQSADYLAKKKLLS